MIGRIKIVAQQKSDWELRLEREILFGEHQAENRGEYWPLVAAVVLSTAVELVFWIWFAIWIGN